MKRSHLVVLLAGLVLFGIGSISHAAILTFDDIPGSFPPGYGGLDWDSNMHPSPKSGYQAWGNTYEPPSGDNVVHNNSQLSVTITSTLDFDFNGAYFVAFGENDTTTAWTSNDIVVEGYNNNVLVDTVTMGLRADGFDWLQADLLGVDELRIISSLRPNTVGGTWWLMDNFIINEPAPVPEPATMFLLGAGLIGLVGFRGQSQQKKGVGNSV